MFKNQSLDFLIQDGRTKVNYIALIHSQVKSSDSPVWCGRPPKCKFYPKMRMVLCKDIKRLPEFDATLMKRTTSITIARREMCKFPEQMLNKSAFISLQNISILKTCIGCDEIGLFRNKRRHIKKQEETTLILFLSVFSPEICEFTFG